MSDERKDYINKLSAQIKGIEDILFINSKDVIDEDIKHKLMQFKNRADDLKKKLEKMSLRLLSLVLKKPEKVHSLMLLWEMSYCLLLMKDAHILQPT